MDIRNELLQSSGRGGTISSAGVVPYGNIASQTNQFMTGEAMAPFLANLPNYAAMTGQRSTNTSSLLKGEVPSDVITQILQQAAERGIMTGSPGSDNSNAAMLRALGLTSLGLQQQGSQNLSQSIADTPVPQLFYPQSIFTPEHMANQELSASMMGGGSGGGYGGFQVALPGGRLGQGVTNPAYGTVGAGAPSGPIYGATGPFVNAQPLQPYSSSDWWSDYGGRNLNSSMDFGQTQQYWDSPAGLQNPNRPADEVPFDSWYNNETDTYDAPWTNPDFDFFG